MKFVEGETIARKILRDAEYKNALQNLAFECGESIAKIHQADIAEFSFLPKKTVKEQLSDLYETYTYSISLLLYLSTPIFGSRNKTLVKLMMLLYMVISGLGISLLVKMDCNQL